MTLLDYINKKPQDQGESLTLIQSQLLAYLQEHGPTIRSVLVTQLKTPRTTVYDNLLKLQKRKLVEKYPKSNGKRGAPVVVWRCKN